MIIIAIFMVLFIFQKKGVLSKQFLKFFLAKNLHDNFYRFK